MAERNSREVVPNSDGGWDVRKPGAPKASGHFQTQADAVDRAREILLNDGGGELRTHGRDGKIRAADTIGRKDPRSTKGWRPVVDRRAEELARQGVQSATHVSQLIQQQFPNARLKIETVNVRNDEIEVLNLIATYADGTVQRIPRMIVDLWRERPVGPGAGGAELPSAGGTPSSRSS